MNTLRLIIGFIIVLVVALAVAFQRGNYADVYPLANGVSTGVLIVLAWAFGVVSFGVYALVGEIQLRTRLARSQKEKDLLMRELNELRNLPLAGEESQGESPNSKPGEPA